MSHVNFRKARESLNARGEKLGQWYSSAESGDARLPLVKKELALIEKMMKILLHGTPMDIDHYCLDQLLSSYNGFIKLVNARGYGGQFVMPFANHGGFDCITDTSAMLDPMFEATEGADATLDKLSEKADALMEHLSKRRRPTIEINKDVRDMLSGLMETRAQSIHRTLSENIEVEWPT